jgi:hypothetical protein
MTNDDLEQLDQLIQKRLEANNRQLRQDINAGNQQLRQELTGLIKTETNKLRAESKAQMDHVHERFDAQRDQINSIEKMEQEKSKDRLTRQDEILLKEYAEAGHAYRQIETLTRTALAIFATLFAATFAFITQKGTYSPQNIPLEIFGLMASIVVWRTTERSRQYGLGYMDRIKEIELELNMAIYKRGREIKNQWEEENNACRFTRRIRKLTNKDWLISIAIISIYLYLFLITLQSAQLIF